MLDNVLWQEAHDKCIGDGTQLAIAYSAQDIGAMKKVLGIEGKDTQFFADREKYSLSIKYQNCQKSYLVYAFLINRASFTVFTILQTHFLF